LLGPGIVVLPQPGDKCFHIPFTPNPYREARKPGKRPGGSCVLAAATAWNPFSRIMRRVISARFE
jgi:hypothetical protein